MVNRGCRVAGICAGRILRFALVGVRARLHSALCKQRRIFASTHWGTISNASQAGLSRISAVNGVGASVEFIVLKMGCGPRAQILTALAVLEDVSRHE